MGEDSMCVWKWCVDYVNNDAKKDEKDKVKNIGFDTVRYCGQEYLSREMFSDKEIRVLLPMSKKEDIKITTEGKKLSLITKEFSNDYLVAFDIGEVNAKFENGVLSILLTEDTSKVKTVKVL